MRIRSRLARAASAAAVLAGVCAVPSAAFAGGSAVPFTDPNQVGSLTLCNQHGKPVTSGSLLTVPFVWSAVSSARVPAGYSRATLEVFQPIEYVAPGDWSGYQLTDDAIFSNPAHPIAQATYADAPLIWPDQSMPPHWDGLYQLRMVFSAPDRVPWVSSYPAAVVEVTGSTWKLVQGGGSSCTGSGKAVSVATLVLPKSETATPKSPAKVVAYGSQGGKGSTAGAGGSPTGTGAASGSGAPGSPAAAGEALAGGASRSAGGSGSPAGLIVGAAVAVLALAGGAALLAFRRRRRPA